MKKIISLTLAVLFVLTLASCGKKGPDPDNWHNNSGINRWFSVNVDGKTVNVGGVFTETGVDLYNNDSIEKELFCTVTYPAPDANPEMTEQALAVDDIDHDGTSELLFTFTAEDGTVTQLITYWNGTTFAAK